MRTFDATFLNSVANHPDIRPTLGGTDPVLDLSVAVSKLQNYCFVNEFGGFVGMRGVIGAPIIECHTMFLPHSPPRKIVRFMQECQEYLFTRTDCTKIVTKVADDNVSGDKLSILGGFKEDFRRENAWKLGIGVSYRSLPLDRWLAVCSSTLEAGKAFHKLLEDHKKAKGSALQTHEDDEIHDRWVGAAMLMALRGNVVKGVDTYNIWAAFAGYMPVVLLSEQPPVVDIHDAVIGTDGTNLQVLHCR